MLRISAAQFHGRAEGELSKCTASLQSEKITKFENFNDPQKTQAFLRASSSTSKAEEAELFYQSLPTLYGSLKHHSTNGWVTRNLQAKKRREGAIHEYSSKKNKIDLIHQSDL